MRSGEKQAAWIFALFGILPVVWLALLTAPYLAGGLPEIIRGFPDAMNHPFSIRLCGDSLRAVLIFLLIYGIGIGIYVSTRRNYRRGEEHGSAAWGNARAVNQKYSEKDFGANKIMTSNVRISYDSRRHRRNLLTIVVGGSGAGKTRFYAKPNLMQANTSFVVLDPKGENLRDTGHLLEGKGYEVRVLDLINMEKSHCYNPFMYLKDENDVQRLKMLKSSYDSQRYSLQDNFMIRYPKLIKTAAARLECVREDAKSAEAALLAEPDFAITVDTAGNSVKLTERVDGGTLMLQEISKCKNGETTHIGKFKGFELLVEKNFIGVDHMVLRGRTDYKAELSTSPVGNMVKLENLCQGINQGIPELEKRIEQYQRDMEQSKQEYMRLYNEKSMGEVKEACRKVGLLDFIQQLPDKFETILEPDTLLFSSGMKQKFNFVRAILHPAPIMLFDEITSDLDGNSEKNLVNTLKDLGKNSVVISVSHRVHAVQNSDKIFVLDQGRIVDQGNWGYLIENCPLVKSLFQNV